MFEVLRVQAVAFREEKPQTARIERQTSSETRIKLGALPKAVKGFFDFVPLGFQLEAYVKRATKDEITLRVNFLGRWVEITVKNLLGLELKPNQKVVLTLIEKNPYVLKLSLPLEESFKIFSRIREFFKTPLPRILGMLINIPSTLEGIKNSGLFYERKVVEYLMGREKPESLKRDLKYKLLQMVKGWKFDKPRVDIFIRPLGVIKSYYRLPFYRVDLARFLSAYGSFYKLSPSMVERFAEYIYLARASFKKKFPHTGLKRVKKRELDKPLFFSHPSKGFYKTFSDGTISFNLLKETVDFIHFLQGWSIVNDYQKVVIPFPYKGRRFFLGFYRSGVNKNISLLWENGLVKITYRDTNPWQGEILFVVNDEHILKRLEAHKEELKRELEKIHFNPTEIKFASAQNVEELFILDMADKEHSNFVKIYL